MEAVSMKADKRLQARSLACRPVGEHRAMVVVVMMMRMKMMMKNGIQNEGRGIRQCLLHTQTQILLQI